MSPLNYVTLQYIARNTDTIKQINKIVLVGDLNFYFYIIYTLFLTNVEILSNTVINWNNNSRNKTKIRFILNI